MSLTLGLVLPVQLAFSVHCCSRPMHISSSLCWHAAHVMCEKALLHPVAACM